MVTALCRIFARRGWHVAPFKAQNMSNNAAVCADGAEIGRAQFTQAQAAGIEPSANMNPILLKPEADARSQVVVLGQPAETLAAKDYYTRKQALWQIVTKALDQLRSEVELVIIEGAGSPVELNLKHGDIVNMAVAKYANAPVLLVGDIDRGGVFAQLLGTLWLLDPDERELVRGLIVNKFRGDITLFDNGIKIIEEKGGIPVLGVMPYIKHGVPEEDAVAIEPQNTSVTHNDRQIDIVIIRLPRIANFDDFDPLQAETGVQARYIDSPGQLGTPQAIIIPGTKSTIADLLWLRETGLFNVIQNFALDGGVVVGICGGYQMLGQAIRDKDQVESEIEEVKGLGLLPTITVFEAEKSTHQIKATVQTGDNWLTDITDRTLTGYEIHMGQTKAHNPWLLLQRSDKQVADGSMTDDGRVWGCYIHGLFHNTSFRQAWLTSLGWDEGLGNPTTAAPDSFDIIANAMEAALDMAFIEQLLEQQ